MKGFPLVAWITGQTTCGTREIPHGALALERPRVGSDRAVHREATEGTKREGQHRGLQGNAVTDGLIGGETSAPADYVCASHLIIGKQRDTYV